MLILYPLFADADTSPLNSRLRMQTQQHSRRRWGRGWRRGENGFFNQYFLGEKILRSFFELWTIKLASYWGWRRGKNGFFEQDFLLKSLISQKLLWTLDDQASEEEVMFLVKFGTTVNTDRLRTIVKNQRNMWEFEAISLKSGWNQKVLIRKRFPGGSSSPVSFRFVSPAAINPNCKHWWCLFKFAINK